MDGKKILVAEDDAFALKVFSSMMDMFKQTIDTACDGAECVKKYQASPAAYKMIFMDLQMPNVDGYEAAKSIRAFEKSKGLPKCKIVAMSGYDDEETQDQVKEYEMDAIVSKPLKPAQLKSLI